VARIEAADPAECEVLALRLVTASSLAELGLLEDRPAEAFVQQSTQPSPPDEELPYRLYSREEILEFRKDDELDPETVKRIEERLKIR
jgi:hypothetical protein